MDVVGMPLEKAVSLIQEVAGAYEIERTYPTRDFFPIDESNLYVVRQRIGEDGVFHLLVAAKMRKEVL